MGGNISGGNFLGGKFPQEIFQGGSLMGGNFLGGNFAGGKFPRTLLYKLLFQKHSPRSVLWKTYLEILRKIGRNRLCRSRFFNKIDYVPVYFRFWFYKLFLLMESFTSFPQGSCSAKFHISYLKTPVTELSFSKVPVCRLKLCNKFFSFFIEYFRAYGIYWCIVFNASILKVVTTVLLLHFDTWPYAALPKEHLIIGLLNNIKTFPNQSFRGALWNSFSKKKSRNIPRKMSVVDFHFKKTIWKGF